MTEKPKEVVSKMDETRFFIRRARLSYPSLVEHAEFGGKTTGKYTSTLLIPKAPKILLPMETHIREQLVARKMKVNPNNYFYNDGDNFEYPGWEGHWALKCSSKIRPRLINAAREPMSPEEFYAGCWVNAIIEPWIQRNSFDKRVNCNLNGLQFVDDGEPLAEGTPASADDFPDEESAEDFDEDPSGGDDSPF